MLALDWAESTREDLNLFTFVFLVSLRHVDANQPLEHIIMEQHGRLKTEGITESEMKGIMKGKAGPIMLLIDGYDEYTKGTNRHIDDLLFHGRDNCLVILSSRPGDFLKPIKGQRNEEVTISGFSYENITRCADQYLGSVQECDKLLAQAEQANIHGMEDSLLRVPIILLMACTVFRENKCLPSSKTGLFRQVIKMCISRTTLKTMGKMASEVENLHKLMVKLGKLAWEALNRESKQLLIYKVV